MKKHLGVLIFAIVALHAGTIWSEDSTVTSNGDTATSTTSNNSSTITGTNKNKDGKNDWRQENRKKADHPLGNKGGNRNYNEMKAAIKDNVADSKSNSSDNPGRQNRKDTKSNFNGKELDHPPVKKFFQSLSPEDKKKMYELYKNDPEKFRKEIREKVIEYRKQERDGSPAINETLTKMKKAQTPDEKNKYQTQLKEQTAKEFYARQDQSRANLEDLEKRVKALRQVYEMRKNNADKIINDRVENLSQDQELDW